MSSRIRRAICLELVMTIVSIVFLAFGGAVCYAADLTLDEIISKGKAKYDAVKTMSVTVTVQMMNSSTKKTTDMSMTLLADNEAGISRMTFVSPAAFKGQVLIIDESSKVMKMYTKSTNQVLVTKLDSTSSASMGMGMDMGFDFSGGMKMPDKSTHDIKLLGKEKVGKVEAYIISVKAKKEAKSGSQKMWLSTQSLDPVKIELYDSAGKPQGTILMSDLRTGVAIDRKKLIWLPPDAEVIKG